MADAIEVDPMFHTSAPGLSAAGDVSDWIQILVTNADTIPREALQVVVEGAALPGVAHYAFLMLRRLTTLRGVRRDQLITSEMPDLAVPTRFVWGEDDAFCRPGSAYDLLDRMPNADLRLVPRAGHLPQLDRPDDVAQAVSSFLDDAESPA